MKRFCCYLLLIALNIIISAIASSGEWVVLAEAPRGVPSFWVNQLLVNPSNPKVLYAATEGAGFLVSEDGGKTWVPRNEGFTTVEEGTVSGYQVRCIAVNPSNPNIIYAGMAAFGVFKSEDGGLTWKDISATLGDTFTKAMAIHPSNPNVVYLGTDGGGMYRYDANKNRWEEIVQGLKNTYVKAIAIDPSDPKTIYVATDGGVAKTINGGNSWEIKNNGLTTRYVLCLAIDPKNPKVLYAGTDGGGLFKTEDGANSWSAIGGEIWLTKPASEDLVAPGADVEATLVVSSVIVNPSEPSIVYAANQSGIFMSKDAGKTWAQINAGLSNTNVKSLAVNSLTKPVTVYASTSDGKLYYYKE